MSTVNKYKKMKYYKVEQKEKLQYMYLTMVGYSMYSFTFHHIVL